MDNKTLKPIHIVQSIDSLRRSDGGTTAMACSLLRELTALGCDVSLVSIRNNEMRDSELLIPKNSRFSCNLVEGWNLPVTSARWAPGYFGALNAFCSKGQQRILHDHGLWGFTNHMAARVARKARVPLIVSTHGMLLPWAIHHGKWKKQIAWWAYQRRNLNHVAAFHATSEQELAGLREAGLVQPIAVIPIGVDMPKLEDTIIPHLDLTSRCALFVGRIHPVKGLMELVQAWAIVRPPGWRMTIVGPDSDGYGAALKEFIASACLEGEISILGETYGKEKEELFQGASLFIMPSHTENFGLAVLEALSYGLPVLSTMGTPWKTIADRGCGWWVPGTVEDIAGALNIATNLSQTQLTAKGRIARRLAEEFDWEVIANSMLELYRWILGGGKPPDFVQLAAR